MLRAIGKLLCVIFAAFHAIAAIMFLGVAPIASGMFAITAVASLPATWRRLSGWLGFRIRAPTVLAISLSVLVVSLAAAIVYGWESESRKAALMAEKGLGVADVRLRSEVRQHRVDAHDGFLHFG